MANETEIAFVTRARVLARLAGIEECAAEAGAALEVASEPVARASAHRWRGHAQSSSGGAR